jgi:hypothetical protein
MCFYVCAQHAGAIHRVLLTVLACSAEISLALNAFSPLSVSGLPAARARAATLGKARVRAP